MRQTFAVVALALFFAALAGCEAPPEDGEASKGAFHLPLPAGLAPVLAIELSWETDADLDLHLLNESDGPCDFYEEPCDCFYANMNPAWGGELLQDSTSFGPENVRVVNPDGNYRVLAAFYQGSEATTATADIRLGATSVESVLTIPGPAIYWDVGTLAVSGTNAAFTATTGSAMLSSFSE